MPKASGSHPDKALSAMKVRQVTKEGRYPDGNGLYLVVSDTGAKRWMLRIIVHGRRRDMGLGGTSIVSLAEARELALLYRKVAREGGDPIDERRKERTVIPTFAEAARQVHAESKPTWKNPKHAQQWINTLEAYAIPIIGNMRLDHIKSGDVLRVLSPIWLEKAETARRVRQRLSTVFDWAKASGYRTTDNPVDSIEKGLPKQTGKQKHHASMPFVDVPAFVKGLQRADKRGLIARRAFEFLILNASRTTEVREAQWSEFDLKAKTWVISAERMKMDREHRIPLSERSIAIIEEMSAMRFAGDLVFPGTKYDKPMSNMVFSKILERLDIIPEGQTFTCTPTHVWDGDGPIWCKEGPRLRLAGIAARELDGTCSRGHPCPKANAQAARGALVELLGTPTGVSRHGHILIVGPTLRCRSGGSAKRNRTAAWCVSPRNGDINCAMVREGWALRWDRFWRGHSC